MEHLKAVVVGDGTVGKSCMLISYTSNQFYGDHLPTIFDNFSANVMTDAGTVVHLDLWDTAGQEDYDGLRPLSYPASDVFILCFSLISHVSLANAQSKWAPELRAYDKRNGTNTPIILVGTKIDIRNELQLAASKAAAAATAERRAAGAGDFDSVLVAPPAITLRSGLSNASTSNMVTYEQGAAVSEKLGCSAYLECSALTQDGLKSVFMSAIACALKKKQHERGQDKPAKNCMGCSIM